MKQTLLIHERLTYIKDKIGDMLHFAKLSVWLVRQKALSLWV